MGKIAFNDTAFPLGTVVTLNDLELDWGVPLETDFIMTVSIDNARDGNRDFTLEFFDDGGTYSGLVNMDNGDGDEAFSSYNASVFTKTYTTDGDKTIRLSGTVGRPNFNQNASGQKIRRVNNLGMVGWRSFQQAFRRSGLTHFTAGNTDTSNVDNFFQMFEANDDQYRNLVYLDMTNLITSTAQNIAAFMSGQQNLVDVVGVETAQTQNVRRADEFAYRTYALDTSNFDISTWRLDSMQLVNGSGGMFNFFAEEASQPSLTQAVYDQCLINWAPQAIQEGGWWLGLNNSPYTTGGAAEAARAILIDNIGVYIVDDGNAAPDQPDPLTATPFSATQIDYTLPTDPFTNGKPIFERDVRHSTDETTWTVIDDVPNSTGSITGLAAETLYYIQWQAENGNGTSAWSSSVQVTTLAAALTAPTAVGSIADQVLTEDTGIVTIPVPGLFDGEGITHSITSLTGVTISSASIQLDTGTMALQTATTITVTASNGTAPDATITFDLTVNSAVSPVSIASVIAGAESGDNIDIDITATGATAGNAVYATMQPAADAAPSAAQVVAAQAGAGGNLSGSWNDTWPGPFTVSVASDLDDDFIVYVVVVNAGGNSNVAASGTITIDTTTASGTTVTYLDGGTDEAAGSGTNTMAVSLNMSSHNSANQVLAMFGVRVTQSAWSAGTILLDGNAPTSSFVQTPASNFGVATGFAVFAADTYSASSDFDWSTTRLQGALGVTLYEIPAGTSVATILSQAETSRAGSDVSGNVAAGEAVIAAQMVANGSDPAWTGLTKDYGVDAQTDEWFSSASESNAAAATPRTITTTGSSTETAAISVKVS